MSSLWMVVVGLWCGAVLLATGCNPDATAIGAAPNDVYLARPRTNVFGKLTLRRVINQIGGGGIIIVTGRSGEISTDGIATASGKSLEAARIGAGRRITVTNDAADNVEVRLLPETDEKAPPLQFGALLHVAVPPATDLPYINTPTGNIGVYGNVGNVTAVISDSGNIEVYGNVGDVTATITNTGNIAVRGAGGNVNLSTRRGSIVADIMPGRVVMVRAAEGDIDIHAVDALVSAETTGRNIRFYGTLRAGLTHNFTTTAAGSIKVALPPYPGDPAKYSPSQQIYRFYVATSEGPVNVEYPALGTSNEVLPICGFIHGSGPYDYHVENTPARTGRIEVSPGVTGTDFFSGTLATNYFRFETDNTRVAFYTPLPQSIHIYTAAQLNQIRAGKEPIVPECQAALEADAGNAIVLRLTTGSGPVYIHNMLMPKE